MSLDTNLIFDSLVMHMQTAREVCLSTPPKMGRLDTRK